MSQNVAKGSRKINKAAEALEFLADTRSEAAALHEKQQTLLDQAWRVKGLGTWSSRTVALDTFPGRIGYSEIPVTLYGTQLISVPGTRYSVALQERISDSDQLVKRVHLIVHNPSNVASEIHESDVHTYAVFEPDDVIIDGLDNPTFESLDAAQELIGLIETSPDK